jgi:hypothetical protein
MHCPKYFPLSGHSFPYARGPSSYYDYHIPGKTTKKKMGTGGEKP